MKKYLLGPNAANFLANQMRNQGASTEEPVLHRGRVSGSIIPFKITGDWEQRNGESVYSCIAHEVFFDGTNYVTDQESLDFFLYSPIHLSEKPDNAVGDIIFAVLRGNNWEIIGGGGGGNVTIAVTAGVTTKNTPSLFSDGLLVADLIPNGRAIPSGAYVLATKPKTGSNYSFIRTDALEVLDTRPLLPVPTITVNSNRIKIGNHGELDDLIATWGAYYLMYRIVPYPNYWNQVIGYETTKLLAEISLPAQPATIQAYYQGNYGGQSSSGNPLVNRSKYIGSGISAQEVLGANVADFIRINPAAGNHPTSTMISFSYIGENMSDANGYSIWYRRGTSSSWRKYTTPFALGSFIYSGQTDNIYTQLRYGNLQMIEFDKGQFTNTGVS